MAKVLVVGGAGYVGSTTCAFLLDQGNEVWVYDSLSTGHRELVLGGHFIEGEAGDRKKLAQLFAREKFDCVLHFAAKSLVSESVAKPQEYYENNVTQTQALLETMLEAGVKNFVFSSTAGIFGDPKGKKIDEDFPKNPTHPYGQNKLEVENWLKALADRGLRSVALRYFNAAGADPKLRVGELHEPESHLIRRVLKAALEGTPVEIYGDDYPTPDGTCIRDFVYVWELARAHQAALNRLLRKTTPGGSFEVFNLGTENGNSVREVVDLCQKVTGRKLKVAIMPRRPADPPMLVAASALAQKELGFRPDTPFKQVIQTAWKWECRKSKTKNRAIFLDRDGTINEDPGYLSDPAQMKLLPGVGKALAQLKSAGYLLVVVSNQSGVGRGLIKPEAIPSINERLDELLAEDQVAIDHFELCFHRPDEDCACRKPKPKLLQDAAELLNIDCSKSFMVGDKLSDVGAGFYARCKGSVLVRTGQGKESEAAEKDRSTEPDFVGSTLLEVANWILKQKT